jgi:hypothetical protein
MNIYEYIAISNPDSCLSFCNNYGYVHREIGSIEELVVCMQEVVAAEGETAFTELLKLHPDRGAIMETFSGRRMALGYDGSLETMPINYVAPQHKRDCQCGCNNKSFNADASLPKSSGSSTQTNTFIIAAALLLSVAIISRK